MQSIGLFCRALLQKRPTFLRSLLIVGTRYGKVETHVRRRAINRLAPLFPIDTSLLWGSFEKEPYILAKEPCISAKGPYTSAKRRENVLYMCDMTRSCESVGEPRRELIH